MTLRKRGSLQRSISGKDAGQVEAVWGMFLVTILAVLLYTRLQLAVWQTAGMYLEDALAASNLASALIDVEEYGRSNKIIIEDMESAYQIYEGAVRENLQLDGQWENADKELISGRVEIADYIIYNVDGTMVYASRIARDGHVAESWRGRVGEVYAPNGLKVEHTGVYSEITFPVRGFRGMMIPAHKGKLVEIVDEKGAGNEG